jgi:selenocysteine lyase/cysteine desulfurase
VTTGVHALFSALPRETLQGRRVLVAADCFPSVHFLLTGMAQRHGFTLDTVPIRQGAAWVEPEDYLAHWTPDVGVALITWISSTTSHRVDLAPMVAHGRAMGSVIGVDVTQGAGLLPFDVTNPAVDFTVSTSLKWMCGTPGAGILHVAPDLTAACAPELRGWFSQPDPFSWALDRFAYAPDIRRFDSGTPGVMAAAASLPALDWHAQQDRAALAAQNAALQGQLLDGFRTLGLPMLSPEDPARRGGSLMVRLPDSHPAPVVLDGLRARGIFCDARGQTFRASSGAMTTAEGTDRLIGALRSLL